MPTAIADPKAPMQSQPSLWDVLIRTVRPKHPRVRRRTRARTVAESEAPTIPLAVRASAAPALQPLRVGPPWPSGDVALVVEGNAESSRRYSFRRALWCGAQCYALLAPWEQRDDGMAALVSVEIERVRIVAQMEGDRVDGTSETETREEQK